MDIETLLAEVRDQLDQPDSSYLTDALIVRWLNQAQRVVARKTKCLKKEATIPTIADQFAYELTDCMGVITVMYVESATMGYRLTNISMGNLARTGLQYNVSSRPVYWVDMPDGPTRNIVVAPAPAITDYWLLVWYYALPTPMVYTVPFDPLNVDPEISEEYQDVLVTWCRYKYRLMEEDPNQALSYLDEFNRELKEIRSEEFFKNDSDAPDIALDYTF